MNQGKSNKQIEFNGMVASISLVAIALITLYLVIFD